MANSPTNTQRLALPMAWLPVFIGLTVISVESTVMMGGANTGRWLLELCNTLWGQTDGPSFERAHFLLRKLGHFCGYGTLSVLFYRAWFVSVSGFWKGSLRGLRFEAAGLAVSSTFVIACLDEWHQSFLTGRVSSFYDVLIDTSGAVLFHLILLVVVMRRRRAPLLRAVA